MKVMIRFIIVIAGLLLLGTASVAEENSAGVDIELMQTIEEVNDSLSSNISMEAVDAALSDAQLLDELFMLVEQHFVAQGNDNDAIELAQSSKKSTEEIVVLLQEKNFESAAATAIELSRNCKSCHNIYEKEESL